MRLTIDSALRFKMSDTELSRLPEEVRKSIPSGEKIYWCGQPDWVSLGYCCYGIKYLIFYFLVSAFYVVYKIVTPLTLETFLSLYSSYLFSGFLAGMILFGIAFLSARHTCYIITEKRIVIRTGVALVFLLNLPFKNILSIDRQKLTKNRGNIAFTVRSRKRIPYLSCWPSVKGRGFLSPIPAFRSISDVEAIERLVGAMAEKNQNGDESREHQEATINHLNSGVPA